MHTALALSLGNLDYSAYDVFTSTDLSCHKNDVFIVVLCFLGCKESECLLWTLPALLNKCHVGAAESGVK